MLPRLPARVEVRVPVRREDVTTMAKDDLYGMLACLDVFLCFAPGGLVESKLIL